MSKIAALAILALGLSGCASVVRGTTEDVAFASDPPGAQVMLSTGQYCPATPCSLKVARSDNFTATLTKEGFKPTSAVVTTRLSGSGAAVGAGNVLVGGVIGLGVDAYNGANLDHDPNPVFVRLAPLEPPAAEKLQPRKRKLTS